MTPRLSVLMSVYNGGKFLSEAVESVLASDMADFEFVIVDNVSTDGSRGYLRGLRDSRIKLIENEKNLGQTGALNVGLQAAAAPVIARLDADDICLPGRFTEQLARIEEDPSLGLIGGQAIRINETGAEWGRTRLPTAWPDIHARMMLQNCFVHSSVMFRRDAALKCGAYPASFRVSQDFALFSALMRDGYLLENLEEPVCKLRAHPDQVMATGGRADETEETITVAAENQAWAAHAKPDNAMARTVHRLWSGKTSTNREATIPPRQAIARFFDGLRLSRRQMTLLALVLCRGPCDGSLALKLSILVRAVRFGLTAR